VARGKLDLADVHQIEVFDGELTTYKLVKGDLLVVEGNGSVDQIGRAAMWDGSIDGCVHQNHLIRVRPGDEIVPEFLALVWNAPSTIAQLKSVASSTSGLHTLSTGKVKRVKLKVPGTDVQEKLVAEAERRLSLIEASLRAVTDGLVKVEQLRHTLLAAAFKGQLVEQNPDEEPAEVTLDRIRKVRAGLATAKVQRGARRARAT
jgi:type I restriction enzyme S subunit